MLKKGIALIVAFLLLLCGVRMTEARALEERLAAAQSIPGTQGLETKAKAALVMDADNGRVLFAKNANARLPMASTTKILSALLALEQEDLDERFTVDTAAIHVEGSSMGLREGDQVTLRALAYGMLLPSGNDAAGAAAVRIAGSRERFAAMMNARAAEIGMEDSHFVTPSGLDDPEHYSSAYDMALLAREALENPLFAEICAKPSAKIQYGNPPYDRWLQNHNRLLKSYPGTVGVKTGFTDEAGRCLVSCAERDGVRLIVVTLSCPDDWNEHKKLYDHYFGLLRVEQVGRLVPDLKIPVTGGERNAVAVSFDEPDPVALMDGERVDAAATAAPFLYAPVKRGQVVGNVKFTCDGQPVAEVVLTAARDVDAKEPKPSLWARLFGRLGRGEDD